MTLTEYRVVWQREGQSRLSTRCYQRRSSAEHLFQVVAGDPHNGCTHEEGYCYWETGGGDGSVPPFFVEPRIEVRDVGPWEDLA